MVRIISALCALACILLGAMLITQQGIFAQNLNFDSEANSGRWSGKDKPTATVTVDGEPSVVEVRSQYSVINRHSH